MGTQLFAEAWGERRREGSFVDPEKITGQPFGRIGVGVAEELRGAATERRAGTHPRGDTAEASPKRLR